jgi:hypothetical protein
VLCRSLFVLLSLISWPLYCLSFALRILVSLLVSSNAPWETTKVYLVLYVCCVDRCSSFCTFSFVYSDIRILIAPLVSSKSSLQFPHYQGQREPTGYILTISPVPRTKGNNRGIFCQYLQYQGQRETIEVYFDNSLRTKDKGKQPEYILTILSAPRTKGNNLSIFWQYLQYQEQRETTGVYFDNFLSTNDKGKQPEYILIIPSVPRTKGNNRSIFWQFLQH